MTSLRSPARSHARRGGLDGSSQAGTGGGRLGQELAGTGHSAPCTPSPSTAPARERASLCGVRPSECVCMRDRDGPQERPGVRASRAGRAFTDGQGKKSWAVRVAPQAYSVATGVVSSRVSRRIRARRARAAPGPRIAGATDGTGGSQAAPDPWSGEATVRGCLAALADGAVPQRACMPARARRCTLTSGAEFVECVCISVAFFSLAGAPKTHCGAKCLSQLARDGSEGVCRRVHSAGSSEDYFVFVPGWVGLFCGMFHVQQQPGKLH